MTRRNPDRSRQSMKTKHGMQAAEFVRRGNEAEKAGEDSSAAIWYLKASEHYEKAGNKLRATLWWRRGKDLQRPESTREMGTLYRGPYPKKPGPKRSTYGKSVYSFNRPKRRDPSKVTNLAAFREKKRASSVSRATQDYELREVQEFQRQIAAVEKLPLSERKENAREFAKALHRHPELVAERVGWLLNGSYGRGAYTKAMQVARSPRMNQGAWLVQTVAALEWSVPPRMTAQAWHTLSATQRTNLERLVKREIRDALEE